MDRKAVIGLIAAVGLVGVSNHAVAQQGIPKIRPLGRIERTSADSFVSIYTARVLPSGRVIVNDARDQRLVLLDSSLQTAVTIADTTTSTSKAYGDEIGTLYPFLGDSSLFVDRTSRAMLVIDPNGKLSHVIAIPGPSRATVFIMNNGSGLFDGRGHFFIEQPAPGADPPPDGHLRIVHVDSGAVARIAIGARTMDTVGRLATSAQIAWAPLTSGGMSSASVHSPVSTMDAWTVMTDGTVAILRAADYHIDWVAPDGSRSASPKILHEWIRITDSAKTALLDSMKRLDSASKAAAAKRDSARAASGVSQQTAGGRGGNGSFSVPRPEQPPTLFVDAAEIPDYYPAFAGTSVVRPDADGNLWIKVQLPKAPAAGVAYDIVNRQGVLVDRVLTPGSATIVGFGPGVVYLSTRVGTKDQLIRMRMR